MYFTPSLIIFSGKQEKAQKKWTPPNLKQVNDVNDVVLSNDNEGETERPRLAQHPSRAKITKTKQCPEKDKAKAIKQRKRYVKKLETKFKEAVKLGKDLASGIWLAMFSI